jgi:Ca-activated chloride channel family protein
MTTHVDQMTADELARHANPLDDAGTGTLGTERGNLPLDELDLRASIAGLATDMELTQGFHNPYDVPLEATYIFPLPDRAAVTRLRMTAGDRVVEGVLKERGAARADYDQAVDAGQRASIAEEERPGVFTMRVGNILPGERVTIRLTLAGRLPFEDGEATFRFPLVVAPRYIPGAVLPGGSVGDGVLPDTDAVPDASRISPPVLLPHFPNPVRLSVSVDIDPAGLPLGRVSSSLHVTTVDSSEDRCRVSLAVGDRVNRDFVLRLRLGADDAVASSLAVVPDDAGGTFACTVLPPTAAVPDRPHDVVLVLDRSGSMDGWKMVAARRAAARIVDTFDSADRFAVLAFDHGVETPPGLPGSLVAGTDRNRFRAIEHLAGLTARGGTEMLAPLRQAATWLSASGDRDKVIVLVTDGQVGNEDQILQSLAPFLFGVRIHTVGIDTAVNKAFLERLAGLAGGRCELVESEDRLDEAMRHINRRIGRPLVTDLRLVPDGLSVDTSTIAPAVLPDLYPGAPVVITGRYHGEPSGGVTVTGRVSDASWQTSVVASPSEHHGLRAIWARAHVRDLEDRYVTASFGDHDALERQIVAVSLKFGVLCRFTAFVAVDDRVVNAGGTLHRVTQPVELPQGWQMPVAPQAAVFTAMSASASSPPMPRPAGKVRQRTAGPMERAPLSAIIPALPVALHTFARQALDRLRAAVNRPLAERTRLLAELSAELVAVLDRVPGLPEETRTQLRDLAARLSGPLVDVNREWQSAVDILEPLAGQSTRRGRPFWKR